MLLKNTFFPNRSVSFSQGQRATRHSLVSVGADHSRRAQHDARITGPARRQITSFRQPAVVEWLLYPAVDNRASVIRSSSVAMAALSGGETCIKYLMFAFNLVLWLAGVCVLAVGLWLRLDPKTKVLFEGSDSPYVFYTGVYILIGAGVLIIVVGFLGCCGAIQESPCMLGLFFFFLLILFAIEVAAGIWGFSNQGKVVNDVTTFYMQTYNKYRSTGDELLKETLRLIQTGLKCCGPTGTVVDAAKDTCPRGDPLEELITKSCPDAIEELIDSKLPIVGGVGIVIGTVMMFGMIFSMLLCCAIRKSREVV